MGCLERLRRETEAGGKIIGAATGDIADGDLIPTKLEAGDYFVQGAVSAAGNHKVCVSGFIAGVVYGIPAFLRYKDRTKEACPVKNGNDLREETAALTGAGGGVNDKVEFFHR